jgi:hypothetical protein
MILTEKGYLKIEEDTCLYLEQSPSQLKHAASTPPGEATAVWYILHTMGRTSAVMTGSMELTRCVDMGCTMTTHRTWHQYMLYVQWLTIAPS